MKKVIVFCIILFFTSFVFSQISTTKVAEKKEEKKTYDGKRNFLGKDVYQYIGQELYLKGKSESLRKYGYEGFYLDYNKSRFDKENRYKCCDGYNSKYSELAEKYFMVKAVHKHPNSIFKFYLEIEEKESKDKVYYEYNSRYESSFPFVVVAFFEKQKNRVIDKEFVFANEVLKSSMDITTGKPITNTLGQKWKCIDLTIETKYYSLSLVIQNSLREKTIIPYEFVFGKNSMGRIHTASDADKYTKKFGKEKWEKILSGKVVVGFTKEMVLLSWGKPKKINKASYGEQWVYKNKYLYFENGILKEFN